MEFFTFDSCCGPPYLTLNNDFVNAVHSLSVYFMFFLENKHLEVLDVPKSLHLNLQYATQNFDKSCTELQKSP